jgi:hypothetical protein
MTAFQIPAGRAQGVGRRNDPPPPQPHFGIANHTEMKVILDDESKEYTREKCWLSSPRLP